MSQAYLQCSEENCQRKQELNKLEHRCDVCGGLLDVNYEFDAVPAKTLREG